MTAIAIQGVTGSYSEEAARRLLGESARLLECISFAEAMRALIEGSASGAVLPLRNKIVGDIAAVGELIRNNAVRIVDEFDLAVDHQLLGTPDAGLEDVERVSSHIEALRQCKRFLDAYPHIERESRPDTASSVRDVLRENRKEWAAIGSPRAARIYGAKVLRTGISDEAENWTTFGLIERTGDIDHA